MSNLAGRTHGSSGNGGAVGHRWVLCVKRVDPCENVGVRAVGNYIKAQWAQGWPSGRRRRHREGLQGIIVSWCVTTKRRKWTGDTLTRCWCWPQIRWVRRFMKRQYERCFAMWVQSYICKPGNVTKGVGGRGVAVGYKGEKKGVRSLRSRRWKCSEPSRWSSSSSRGQTKREKDGCAVAGLRPRGRKLTENKQLVSLVSEQD